MDAGGEVHERVNASQLDGNRCIIVCDATAIRYRGRFKCSERPRTSSVNHFIIDIVLQIFYFMGFYFFFFIVCRCDGFGRVSKCTFINIFSLISHSAGNMICVHFIRKCWRIFFNHLSKVSLQYRRPVFIAQRSNYTPTGVPGDIRLSRGREVYERLD